MAAEEVLQIYYKKSHQSQPEMALALDVSQTTIHNWISGKHKIPMEFYDRIVKLCGVELVDILPNEWKVLLCKKDNH